MKLNPTSPLGVRWFRFEQYQKLIKLIKPSGGGFTPPPTPSPGLFGGWSQKVRASFSAFSIKSRSKKIHHFLINFSLLLHTTFCSKNDPQMSPKSQKKHTEIYPFIHTLFLSEFAYFLLAFLLLFHPFLKLQCYGSGKHESSEYAVNSNEIAGSANLNFNVFP